MRVSEKELEIFSRQLILPEFTDKKFKKLQSNLISIVGMGGIGCPVSQYLISCGIKKLNIIDYDIIKKNNLNRQNLYSFNDLGKKKVEVAKEKLLGINPYTKINTFEKKITKKNINILKEALIIIDCSDNWQTMRLINCFAVKNNIPLVSASAVGFDIQIILFENKKNKHLCLECIFPNKKEPDLARCETIGILGTTAGLAGLLSAQRVINLLMKFNINNNFVSLIDCKTLLINNIKISKKNTCKLI